MLGWVEWLRVASANRLLSCSKLIILHYLRPFFFFGCRDLGVSTDWEDIFLSSSRSRNSTRRRGPIFERFDNE